MLSYRFMRIKFAIEREESYQDDQLYIGFMLIDPVYREVICYWVYQ